MCGIVGCVLKKDKEAAPILKKSIKRLEYRGYDSIGVATVTDKINIEKAKGTLDKDEKTEDNISSENFANFSGSTGIAHTRWATCGNPNKINAHPHTDCNNQVAVVHNGIISNYNTLKEELEKEGHIFKSETDTEVIPHSIESFMAQGNNLEESLKQTVKKLDGSYAIAAIAVAEPNKIVAAKNKSPLIIGIGKEEKELYLASDIPAILEYTNKIIRLKNNEFAILDENDVVIKDDNGNIIEREPEEITWDIDMAKKEGWSYFMIKEIYEQYNTIKQTLKEKNNVQKIVKQLGEVNNICFVACGTSYHAALTGKYLFQELKGIPTEVILASEFEYYKNSMRKDTLVIGISQSGETADTLQALESIKGKSKSLAIVNVLGSQMTEEADHVIYTQAGPEIGVAATKTYMAQLIIIYLLVAVMAENDELLDKLNKVPDYVYDLLKLEENKDAKGETPAEKYFNPNEDYIHEIAKKYSEFTNFFYIGKGYAFPIALESALKLKEVSYIHAEGYAAGELKHGPLAVLDKSVPVLSIAPPGRGFKTTMDNTNENKARRSPIIYIGPDERVKDEYNKETIKKIADDTIFMNEEIDEIIAPLIYIIPLQIFSFYAALEKGQYENDEGKMVDIDPDKPRNLAKTVTVN